MLVAEWNRLRLAHTLIGHERGALDGVGDPSEDGNHEYCAENRGARQSIRTAMKDLRHSLLIWLKETRRSVRYEFKVRYGANLENHPQGFSASSVKLKIINTSKMFVAFFWDSAKKTFSVRHLTRTSLSFSTRSSGFYLPSRSLVAKYRGLKPALMSHLTRR